MIARSIGSIAEPRTKPFFELLDGHAFTSGIVLDLVFLEVVDLEVVGVWVGEVEAANGGAWMHRAGFGEFDSCFFFGIEEVKEGGFLGVVGLAGVAGGGANALIFFVDELGLGELSGALDAP